jgi:predicted amidohydrolase
MKIAVLERPARFGEPALALAELDALLEAGPHADLVLLPELTLTGYVSPDRDFDLTRFAEPLDGPTAGALRALAVKHRLHLIGPLVEADGGRLYNSMVGFAPDGERRLHYRKRHPWFPEEWATCGNLPHPLVEIGGLQVTLAICYDVHFLADEAAPELEAADLLLFPSAWVERGADSRPELFAELRRRFGVAIANANWGPGRPRISGQGGSVILSEGASHAAGGRIDAEIAPKR